MTSDNDNSERSERGGLNLFAAPRQKAKTTPPRKVKRLEKRISIDLIPMSLEEIEWAMEDAKVQEEEREIQQIRERIQRRKKAKAAAAAATSPPTSRN
ncbi:unnamed protein product [Cylindrotheca closterium]|uniref:Uncharacterized protein n=1 Tax=Cylindrotheca closterium TaxID=2856 RepID=A0AAD2G438_9STRA|nr:unnamed protein product [Cylindrotheca closterium]